FRPTLDRTEVGDISGSRRARKGRPVPVSQVSRVVPMKSGPFIAFFLRAWLLLAIPGTSWAQISLISAPVIEPKGSTGFVGTVKVTFPGPRNGTIHYTLDGSTPTASSEEFDPGDRDGIVVDRTLTLKAIRRQLG